MRANNRTTILDAAIRVSARDGAARLTLEATADEAGLTRGGMTYHFRDRESLVRAMYEHLAAQWEAQLAATAGTSAAEATQEERTAAYITLATTSATSAELELIHATADDPALHEPLDRVHERWTPSPEDAARDSAIRQQFIACLAADGLWSYDAMSSRPITSAFRAELTRQIADLAKSVREA
ncbi:TetR family transcriptional regulator [Herbiconiux liangxiaofengii]|uniref:TetR family transcriptional regulator n=1 Tax=Herbiconiux liangxiaofengii TaxID=3342795 RepID=UPI0035B95B0A